MPHPTGPTNEELQSLILSLKKTKNETNAYVAKQLTKPRREKKPVNISKIQRAAVEGENVIVPAKITAAGEITKKVHVYAWSYSSQAREKIVKAGGTCQSLDELLKATKKGRIIV